MKRQKPWFGYRMMDGAIHIGRPTAKPEASQQQAF
jgi:hypothetical protein